MIITQTDKPLAITMWDTSWIRRRYAGGGFESFDKALDELTQRGYNAVRIDAFPHMIANAPDGSNSERFLDPTGHRHQKFGFAQWGSPWTVYIYPKRDLIDFIKKCEERDVYIILSTWLKPTGEPRNEWLEGTNDFIRIWDETLTFLKENNCLNNVVAVDVNNEFPYGTCNMWLAHQLSSIKNNTASQTALEREKEFYRNYFNTVLTELKTKWPDIPFSASMNDTFLKYDKDMDFSNFDWLDIHLWAEWAKCDFAKETGYFEDICRFGEPHNLYSYTDSDYTSGPKRIPGDINFEKVNEKINESWFKNRSLCEEWLEENIALVAETGKKYGIPYGCTEGWGTIYWLEHPLLSWDMVKDAGLMAARLGSKYGYTFNCQSNFCEPQFITLWNDIDYHKQITDIIKA